VTVDQLTFGKKRLVAWPERMETVLVSNKEPKPDDAPEIPGPVASLAKTLESAGWVVRIAYSRAYRQGQRTGTYRIADFYGVHASLHETCRYRIVAVYWRFADKTHEFAWFPDTQKLEETEKPCGTPGGWTWQDGRIIKGFDRHRVKVTDIKQFAAVRGSVVPGWFAGIARRFAEQAAKALCGKPEEHDPHEWTTAMDNLKLCSGKASKPKETEGN